MSSSTNASTVLALNSGSSSLKFGLFRASAECLETLLAGEAQAIGEPEGLFLALDGDGKERAREARKIADQKEAMERITKLLRDCATPSPIAVGHRLVHGGPEVRHHCLIDASVSRQLEAAATFAPLHAPPALSVLRYARAHFPDAVHVACLDTAFHAALPDVARVLPIAKDLRFEGMERYGFHGLSCESIVRALGEPLPPRIVIAHLGSGCSITAVRHGRSIDTSMGLTPSGGVIMGTRPGDLDPGILLYLLREKKIDAGHLETMIDHRSGLLGISGVASDMRRLHAAASGHSGARLALDMFSYSLRKQIAAMIAALGGADLLVFTGGIGENDTETRAAVCAGLSWLGVRIDRRRNGSRDDPISDPASRIVVRVIPSREEQEIARHTWKIAARSVALAAEEGKEAAQKAGGKGR